MLPKILGITHNVLDVDAICNDRETVLECADSSLINVLWKTSLLNHEGSNGIFMSIGIDTTEIRNMQNELCASESRFHLSMELSEVGLLYKQAGSNEYFMSKNLQKMLGFRNNFV